MTLSKDIYYIGIEISLQIVDQIKIVRYGIQHVLLVKICRIFYLIGRTIFLTNEKPSYVRSDWLIVVEIWLGRLRHGTSNL